MWKPGVGWLNAVLVIVLVLAAGIAVTSEEPPRAEYRLDFADGSMFISDAGESHGGFEFTASYFVSLAPYRGLTMCSGDVVVMDLALEVGLGDPLSEHEFEVRVAYDPDADEILLTLAKTTFRLVHLEEDTVWNHEFDEWYVASWGGYAPEEEIRGEIAPSILGLPEHYYIELRLDIDVLRSC